MSRSRKDKKGGHSMTDISNTDGVSMHDGKTVYRTNFGDTAWGLESKKYAKRFASRMRRRDAKKSINQEE